MENFVTNIFEKNAFDEVLPEDEVGNIFNNNNNS
jgi:hypothetical protein